MIRRHPRLLALAVVLAVFSGTAGLTACDPEPAPDTYVALGDSYVAGPLVPGQSLSPLGCLRSDKNYASLVRSQIKVTKFTDVSCSGADTGDLFAAQNVTPGPANPPQLDALNRQTKVVTLGIGGNDIGFTDIVKNCATSTPWAAPCKDDYVHDGRDELTEKIATVGPKLDRALVEVKKRAPRAKAFVVGYPTVLPETGSGCYPVVPILPADIVYLRAKIKELNALIKARTAVAGLTYVDLATPTIGHDFCQGLSAKWVEGLVPTSVAAPVHPNGKGMAGFAPIVRDRINALVTS